MGSPKAALQTPEGQPFVVAIVDSLRASAEVDDIVIVTGTHHEAIVEALGSRAALVRVVRNPDPDRGQLSSLWIGMDAVVTDASQAFLMTLVDVPRIDASTIRAVVAAWRTSGAPIVRPAIGDRHGHPVLFDRAVFDELRRAPLDQGAKAVIRAHADDLLNVAVADAGCLVDVDTPQDYRKMQQTSSD